MDAVAGMVKASHLTVESLIAAQEEVSSRTSVAAVLRGQPGTLAQLDPKAMHEADA